MLIATFPSHAKRHKVLLFATIERFGNVLTTEHRVRDLSPTGACVDRGEAFRADEALAVTVGSLVAVAANVVWVKESFAGLRFDTLIEIAAALGKAVLTPEPYRVRNPLRHEDC